MKITRVTNDLIGKHVICKISGFTKDTTYATCLIACHNNEYYLCQDKIEGKGFTNRHGYAFTWTISDGSAESLILNSVSEMYLSDFTGKQTIVEDATSSTITLLSSKQFIKINQKD